MSGQNIIDKAIDSIRKHGWHQGSLRSPDGSLCILGACTAVGIGTDLRVLYEQAREDGLGGPLGSVVAFNDDPNTTLEDVLLLMKKASARLDDEQSA